MVTVNVWSEILATPTTAGPVLKFVVARPPRIDSDTVLCAGQNWSGTHCTTVFSSHSNLPVIAGTDLMSRARSAARRSATGALNVTTTGWATPTTASCAGRTDAMAGRYDLARRRAEAGGPATTLAAVTIAARTHRTTPRMASRFPLEITTLSISDRRRAKTIQSAGGTSQFDQGFVTLRQRRANYANRCVLTRNVAQGIVPRSRTAVQCAGAIETSL